MNGHRFNNFFPWEIAQDGTNAEFVNHLGRHELQRYFDRSFATDPNLVEFIDETSGRTNPRSVENVFQLSEDPTQPGRYLAIDAPEFDTHAAGQLFRFSAPPSLNADDVVIEWLTPESTSGTDTGAADHSGHYRNPITLSDGRIVVAHAPQRGGVATQYRFRIKLMTAGTGGFLTAGTPLTSGIVKNVQQYDPDALVSYNGELWELSPVEVRARTIPTAVVEPPLAAPEGGEVGGQQRALGEYPLAGAVVAAQFEQQRIAGHAGAVQEADARVVGHVEAHQLLAFEQEGFLAVEVQRAHDQGALEAGRVVDAGADRA